MTSRVDREEHPKGLSLIVMARDHGYPKPNKAIAYVNITISDINDNAPKFDKFNYVGKVREDSKSGTVITTVQATDIDEGLAGMIIYSITGNYQTLLVLVACLPVLFMFLPFVFKVEIQNVSFQFNHNPGIL